MTVKDLMQRLTESFKPYLTKMEREEFVFAEKGEECLRLVVYRRAGDERFSLERASFMILDYGLVWNKDNKEELDEDELVAGSLITRSDLPLPIFAFEASMHKNKYDHLNADLFPLSRDPRYRTLFCEPVQAIHKKYQRLPGVPPGVVTPHLPKGFTSGGMMSGDFEVSLRSETFSWWFEYVNLFRGFLDGRERYPLLKEPAIIDEGKRTRDLFLANFRKATPGILADIPNLNSEERGRRLGEFLF